MTRVSLPCRLALVTVCPVHRSDNGPEQSKDAIGAVYAMISAACTLGNGVDREASPACVCRWSTTTSYENVTWMRKQEAETVRP
jgi:hypothetical protein